MRENEVIKILADFDLQVAAKADGAYQSTIGKMACDIAISALREIQQYREIGTVEECRKAVEKQKAKEIIIRNWNPTKCPTCGHELSESLGDGYYKHPTFLERCPECGQAIRWEESE